MYGDANVNPACNGVNRSYALVFTNLVVLLVVWILWNHWVFFLRPHSPGRAGRVPDLSTPITRKRRARQSARFREVITYISYLWLRLNGREAY